MKASFLLIVFSVLINFPGFSQNENLNKKPFHFETAQFKMNLQRSTIKPTSILLMNQKNDLQENWHHQVGIIYKYPIYNYDSEAVERKIDDIKFWSYSCNCGYQMDSKDLMFNMIQNELLHRFFSVEFSSKCK